MITFYKRSFPKERFAFKFCENRVRNSRITLTLLFTGVILLFSDCFVGNANRVDEIDFHAHKIKFQDSIASEIEKSLVFTTIRDDDLIHKQFLHHWFYAPKVEATIESINETLVSLFSKQRSTEFNADLKESIRNNITNKLGSFGLQIITQDFVIRSIRPKPLYGQNIIAILPGKFRGTSNDVITVIGAHYDTVEQCPGIDDNGSGATAVMETAKVLSTRRGEFNDTLIFALFDLEEWGGLGSLAFVDHYLIPKELIAKNIAFKGAFIADMILNFDDNYSSQIVPNDVKMLLPEVESEIERNGNRGDFLAIWMRKQVDEDLFTLFTNSWGSEHKVIAMRTHISAINVTQSEIQKYRTFLRSDHASFWVNKNANYKLPLKAILLTDMGPWRGEQQICYHDWCDDTRQLTHKNLAFLKNTIDALIDTIVK